MVKSMTGFGEGISRQGGVEVTAEVKVTNHGSLSVRVGGLQFEKELEHKAEANLKDLFPRGRIEADFQVDAGGEALSIPDPDRVRPLVEKLRRASQELELSEGPSLDHLIQLGVFEPADSGEDLWPLVEDSLRKASEKVKAAQDREGSAMKKELERHLSTLESRLQEVESGIPEVVRRRKEKLRERVSQLLEGERQLDEKRLEEEVALLAEKVDVAEEVARVRTHLQNATQTLQKSSPVGKELNFLAQELKREINTIGAKVKDGELQQSAIDMKLALEQFREQVRNIE